MTQTRFKTNLCKGVEASASLLRDVLFFHLIAQKYTDIQNFLQDADVFHNLYRLHQHWFDECKCGWRVPYQNRNRKVLNNDQWKLLYEKESSEAHGYKPNQHLKLENLDITLLVIILCNCVLFRFKYLEKLSREQNYASVEDLIKTSQHFLWSAWKPNEKCKCGMILPGQSQDRSLSNKQWDSLFKRDNSTPCNFSVREPISSTAIDFATIEIILRNNPQKCVELVNIENIQKIRNKVSHAGYDWNLNTFTKKWRELKASTLALAGYTSPNSESFYTRRFEEIETSLTPETVDTVLSSLKADSVPEKVRNKMERSQNDIIWINSINTTFVPTEVYKSALRIVTKERFVVLKGLAGEGKSSLAYQIAWEYMRDTKEESNSNVLIIQSAKQWRKYVSSWNCQNTLLVLDDFLGKYADNEIPTEMEEWRKLIYSVRSTFQTGTCNSCILVVSEYTYRVYENAFEIDILPAFSTAWQIKEMTLSTRERLQILKSCNADLASDEDLLNNIVENCSDFGFPKCCSIYSRQSTKDEDTFLDSKKRFLDNEVHQLPLRVRRFIHWLNKCHGQSTKNSLASAFKNEDIDNMLHLCENIFIFQSNNSIELIKALRTSLPREPLLERIKQFLQFLYNEFIRLFSRKCLSEEKKD